MQNQIMGYDRTSAIFSPDGHLLQVEYAEKTVRLGAASLGMVCSDGAIIVADKKVYDELMIPESATKIFEIDSHVAATAAGILPDARILIDRVQLSAQQHQVTYGSPIDTESVAKEIANLQQMFSSYGGVRPFAVNMLIAGVDLDNKSSLFITDVVGNYSAYRATAIGENDDKIKEALRKEYKESLNTNDGIKIALEIFKRVLQKNFDIKRFEVVYIKKNERKFIKITGEELKKFLKQ